MPSRIPSQPANQGHLLLAKLGKRVLRPGGLKLTRALLSGVRLTDADVVELAPGRGRTATEIIAAGPRSYRALDRDPEAVETVGRIVSAYGTVEIADAADTKLPNVSADVVIGEAMLTMQSEATKHRIVAEAARLLRPGGRYAIHEMGLAPDGISQNIKIEVRQSLARAVKVNARPLTIAEWEELLVEHGLIVEQTTTAPMALLQPRRLLADEGLAGAFLFVRNLFMHPAAARQVLAMRRSFHQNRQHLIAVAVVAYKPH